MTKKEREALRSSLARRISDWLGDETRPMEGMPWLGDRVEDAMADAAMAVLYGMADAQVYLRREKMLKDE